MRKKMLTQDINNDLKSKWLKIVWSRDLARLQHVTWLNKYKYTCVAYIVSQQH